MAWAYEAGGWNETGVFIMNSMLGIFLHYKENLDRIGKRNIRAV